MKENNRNSIEKSRKKLPQFTTMNVIDGQAGLIIYTSLIFYSLTIDNILNIIVLLILAAVSIATLTGENGILKQGEKAKIQTAIGEEKDAIGFAYNGAKLEKNGGVVEVQDLNNQFVRNGTNATASGTGTITVTFSDTNRSYTIDSKGTITEKKTINWDTIIADANANPDKYKHTEQSITNGDIGIGTDGKPVNLDLWTYEVINSNQIRLYKLGGCVGTPGYKNSNIVDGKIIGTVPQYIKISGNNEFYAVTTMGNMYDICSTFKDCTNLVTAPEIPSSVTDMTKAFYGCTNLTTAPLIPASVTSMNSTFCRCEKLQGTIEINANPTNYGSCFSGAATEGTGLVVSGSSTMLDALIATKSTNSNITKYVEPTN